MTITNGEMLDSQIGENQNGLFLNDSSTKEKKSPSPSDLSKPRLRVTEKLDYDLDYLEDWAVPVMGRVHVHAILENRKNVPPLFLDLEPIEGTVFIHLTEEDNNCLEVGCSYPDPETARQATNILRKEYYERFPEANKRKED